jgi:hypothetical protein
MGFSQYKGDATIQQRTWEATKQNKEYIMSIHWRMVSLGSSGSILEVAIFLGHNLSPN